jgi:S1-C subfamily serine protease
MEPRPASDRKRRFALNCDALRLMIEFSLRPGEFARIGSSSAVEITLPMVGIRDEECRLFMDDGGLLWMAPAGEGDPVSIEPPASFQAGPYYFAITEQAPEPAPPRRAVTALTPPAYTRPSTAPIQLPPARPRRKVAAFITAAAILAAGGVTWWALHSPEAPSAEPRTADVNPTPASAEVPPVVGPSPAPPLPEQAPLQPPANSPPEMVDLEKLAQRVRPCVFLLQVRNDSNAVVSTGTGFAISADGMVATNHHVIKGNRKVEAVTEQGAKFSVVRVVIEAPEDDLAILQLEAKNLAFLPLGNSSSIAAGKRVAVYGSPVGLAGTLTEGIISAVRNEPGEGLPHKGNLLQTTAPVSPGSSGSPLLDAEGNVLGVITLGSSGRVQNLNFAVPVEALLSLKTTAEVVASLPESGPAGKDSGSPSGKQGPNANFYADPLYQKLRSEMKAEDWISALKLAKQLVQKYPESDAAHFNHAYCAAELRLDDQAEASYKQSLALDPDEPVAWNNLGGLLLRRNDAREALSAFERSAALDPDYPKAWHNIVRSCIVLKDWQRAGSALRTLSKLNGEMAWKLADDLSKYRIPNTDLQQAIGDVLAHKEDNTLYGQPAEQGSKPACVVVGLADGDTLVVRSGPGMNFSEVTSLKNGTSGVLVTGKPRMNGSTEWMPIEANGLFGWVRSKYLRPMQSK